MVNIYKKMSKIWVQNEKNGQIADIRVLKP